MAVEIWKWSIENPKLVYDVYIGDGDSSSFRKLVKYNPYKGIVFVRKGECLDMYRKESRNTSKKNANELLPYGKGDRIAHVYTLVIVQHKGDSAEKIHDTLRILLSYTNAKHDHCPMSGTSWC